MHTSTPVFQSVVLPCFPEGRPTRLSDRWLLHRVVTPFAHLIAWKNLITPYHKVWSREQPIRLLLLLGACGGVRRTRGPIGVLLPQGVCNHSDRLFASVVQRIGIPNPMVVPSVFTSSKHTNIRR